MTVELSENHKKHLLITFEQMDESLCSIEYILAPSSSSLFRHFVQDISTAQSELIKRKIAEIRNLMARTLEGLGIPPREPGTNALRMITTKLLFIDLSLVEASSRNIRGYGELEEHSGKELDIMIREIRTHVEKLRITLQPSP